MSGSHPRRPGRRALDVLAFVVNFKTVHCGDSPSLEEIAAGVGVVSRSTVLVHLAALERHGLITRASRRDARRIGIPGAVWRFEGGEPDVAAGDVIREKSWGETGG